MGVVALARQFISDRPDLAGYLAVMFAVTLTGRMRYVVLGLVFGLAGMYCYRVVVACTGGALEMYHIPVAIGVSILAILVTFRFAFK